MIFLLAVGCECGSREPEAPAEEGTAPTTNADPQRARAVTWESIDPPAPSGSLGLNLRESSDGLLATWVEPDTHRVRFSRFAGDAWTSPTTVTEDEKLIANWADFPRSAEGGDGAIYVNAMLQAGRSAYAYEVRLWRSTDAGETFLPLGLLHHDGTETEHGFVSMAPTDDGIRVFWLDGRGNAEEGGTTSVYSAAVHGDADGARIDPEASLDSKVCDCCQTDAAKTASGLTVAYRDRADGEIRDISVVRMTDGVAAQPSSVHRDDWEMAGCPVNGPALAADASRTALAWFTGAEGGSVKLAFHESEGFAAPVLIDAEQPPGRVDVALVDGGAAVSWLARASDHGEVRVRFVSNAGEIAPATSVGETGVDSAAGFPVMVALDEYLYVGYRDADARLRVKRALAANLPRGVTSTANAPSDDLGPLEAGAALPAGAEVIAADDSRLPLSELVDGATADGPLVVAFFARWCQPCREEMHALEALRVAHPDWTVLAVSIDEGPSERAEGVARSWGFGGRVLRDGGAAALLRVPPLPGTFAWTGGGLMFVSVAEVFDPEALEEALTPAD